MTTVTIDTRFCGPRRSGHGGYSSGLVASFVEGPATVRLLAPPPLAKPLDVVRTDDGTVELRDPDAADPAAPLLVASPRPAFGIEVPRLVSPAEAAVASRRFMWGDRHPFPHCFACGTARRPGDAWRIAAGPTDDEMVVAAPAVCPPDLVAADGTVPEIQVWAALDCVTSHPLPLAGASLRPPWLLGTFGVDVVAPVRADADLVAIGWALELDGRKFHSAGALLAEGRVVAVSRAVWVQLRETPAT